MQGPANTDTEGAAVAPLSFVFFLMEHKSCQKIIEQALNARLQVSADLRDGLNRAVNNNVPRVSGFRNASLAPPAYILPQLCEAIPHAADLAAAVAKVWYEVQGELRDAVASELEERQVPSANQSSPAEELQVGASNRRIYEALQHFHDGNPGTDRDEAVFMFQLLTGVTDVDLEPEEGEEKIAGLLDATLKALVAVPATEPEWEERIPEFSANLAALVERKLEQRKMVGPLIALLGSIQEEYAHLLDFFQCDASAWSVKDIAPAFPLQRAQGQGEALQKLLAKYAPIHERAPVVSEELERAGLRAELVPRIMAAAESLGRLFAGEAGSKAGDPLEVDDDEPGCSGQSQTPSPSPSPSRRPGAESEAAGEPVNGYGSVPACDIEVIRDLRAELQDLEEENTDLEHENEGLKTQVKELERELYESRNQEESLRWAVAYRDNPDGPGEVPDLDCVSAAVELAKERYPGQLLFQLNADSEAEESAFKWPTLVWSALQWLATDYFASHLGQNPIGDMDEACRLACGMWYKSSQHDTTMTQFRDSYSTRVDGRLIWLGEHIGKGNSFDPRRTIRIAFDWDRQLQKVVIGYIGQHQRTAAT